jgi:hypothetical protein
MRSKTIAIGFAVAVGLMLPSDDGRAQTAAPELRNAARASEVSAQSRPPRRLRIYPRDDSYGVIPRYNPGPNAVRECNATYVQEVRPSGTVIVPRMSCFWRRGAARLSAVSVR